MSEKIVRPIDDIELRRWAKERLGEICGTEQSSGIGADPLRFIHELQVHKIELEMQNEELRRARDERQKMEALLGTYRDLYDFAPVGYFNLDQSGIIRAVNFTGAGFLGIERSLLVGQRLDLFITDETRSVFHDFLDRVLASETKECCEVVFLKERYSPLFVQIEAVVCDSREECRAVVIDINERKRSENELKKLNEELENRVAVRTEELAVTVENLQFEIVERKKVDERTLRLNRLYAVLSETNQAIVRTKDRNTIFNELCRIAVTEGNFILAWVGLLDDESGELKIEAARGATGYLDYVRIMVDEDPAGAGPAGISLRGKTCFICNDFLGSPVTHPWHDKGRAYGIRASASIALKQEGRVIGTLALYADQIDFFDQQQVELLRQMGADVSFALDNIVRDTRRREAEQALQEEIIERLRTVEALREKEQMLIYQSRQAAMGEMIGNIAHQWRQPLNTLGLIVQELSHCYGFGKLTQEYLDKSVSQSLKHIQHMSNTIDDFKNFFRPDKEKTEFKVVKIIENTLSLVKDSFINQRIDIEIIAKNDPVIKGYRNEFLQVLLNILSNAMDVLTERGIVDPRVTITTFSEGDRAVVTISDNAGGIPEEIMDRIFEPYFTTKGPQAGTGVGLFMSKTIIEKNMGGSLAVRNIANGAEFRIEV